jgi:serine protease AprX
MMTNPNRIFTPTRLQPVLCLLFLVAAGVVALAGIASSGRDGQRAMTNKIAPWVMEHTANGRQSEFMVVIAEQADLRPAAALATKNEKSRFVHDALWNKSQTTQGPILQWLRERGIEHRSFYVVNAILVKGSREIAEELAARPDVARVEGNPQIQNALPRPLPTAEVSSQPKDSETIEPGITYTHAPDVWALGFNGQLA